MNIPSKLRAEMSIKLKEWKPQAEEKERDKAILNLVFYEDMNPYQIARLENPLFMQRVPQNTTRIYL